jgi:regulator of sigma E protease
MEAVLGISFIIIFHEFGHFLAARAFGVEAQIFSLGFGPALYQFNLFSTKFQIALIPLGGYVSLNPTQFMSQPYGVKILVTSAGIICNAVLAYVIFTLLLIRGKQVHTLEVESTVPDSPAGNAEILPGDIIRSYNHQEIEQSPAAFEQLIEHIAQHPSHSLQLTVERAQELLPYTLTISDNHPFLGSGYGWIGIIWKSYSEQKRTFISILRDASLLFYTTLTNLGTLTTAILHSKDRSFVGPIGIISGISQSASFGFSYYLLSLAILSMNIGLFNVLPVPFLDGGQLVRITVESIFGPQPASVIILITLFLLFLIFSILSGMQRQTKQ